MSEKSGILFLTICSQRKNQQFDKYTPDYSLGPSILHCLSPECHTLLLKKRNDAKKLLKDRSLWDGKEFLNEKSWNKKLTNGQDFNGTESGKYLPAIEVYQGRFYKSLGPEGIQYLRQSPHHVLIISGLYGLVLPDERIQIYESPLEDFTDIQEVWRRDNALTKILLDYLISCNIQMIINLSSQLSYISLINWSTLATEYFVKKKHELRVFYISHEIMKGSEALGELGDIFGSSLIKKGESEFLSMHDGDTIGTVQFSKKFNLDREVEILSLIRSSAWEELFGSSKTEMEFVEFKPYLFDDEERFGNARSIEFECFKTIAAFLNTNGGVLYVGINNDCSIRGVDRDYRFLSRSNDTPYPLPQNKDGFRQKYDGLFSKYIGKEHFGKCYMSFWRKDGKDIAIVSVPEKSRTPVRLIDPKTKTERFFVRGSASTRELYGTTLKRYISDHFKSM
jgi:hypothetical protein